ncbi:DNA-binding protein RFXANK [Hetaerina americana]|uniref:DNA-binding protein RFXANK n=1 Tax=Hetaerina americana TaxID=62018 RepID=UPI003A7F3C91
MMNDEESSQETNPELHISEDLSANSCSPVDIKPDLPESDIPESASNIGNTSGIRWPGSWQDGTRKSAFQPYRPTTTVLTNLQRGNVQTQTPVYEPIDVSLHHRAGQGEVTNDDLKEVSESEIDTPDNNGLTPLMWAAAYGQMPTVQLLLKHGADIVCCGPDGESPLHLAAAGGHHDVLRLLLSEGASVNLADKDGNTALMYAAYGDHPHCVNELLLRGADLTMVNENGDTAFGVAVGRGSKLAQSVIEKYLIMLLT